MERGPEVCVALGIQREAGLAEQHVLGLPAGGFEHEVGAAAAQAIGRLVDQIALTELGADADRDGLLGLGYGGISCVVRS